jgi:shikimate kinase
MSANRHDRQGLALVGTRGSGKTTVGRILAERLLRPFVDADVELEGKLGRSIASLFAEAGEPAFRDWEERTLHELTAAHPGVILATGGGVVLREANRKALRSFGFVVWLRADPGTASARLRADRRGLSARPALTAAGTLDELADVLAARSPLYQAVADAVVDTDGRSADEVADAILRLWPPAGPKGNPIS